LKEGYSVSRRKIPLLISILLVISLYLVSPAEYGNETILQRDFEEEILFQIAYTEHLPIKIDNDTHFAEVASNEGWDGSGNSTHPYIIENLNITDDGICIEISDVASSFIIRNCYINSASSTANAGIYLDNVTHSAVSQTIVTEKSYGIRVWNSDNMLLEENTISDSVVNGIELEYTNVSIIRECASFDNIGEGAVLRFSNSNLIISNEFHHNEEEGLYSLRSYMINVSSNNVYSNEASGMLLAYAGNSWVGDNTIYNNSKSKLGTGIDVLDSEDTIITENEIYQNEGAGLFIHLSHRAEVRSNVIYNNSEYGIESQYSDNCSIAYNNIYENGFWGIVPGGGIAVRKLSGWIIAFNSIWNNSINGISLNDVSRFNISTNYITNNTNHGIDGFYTQKITVHNNNIAGNGWNPFVVAAQCGISSRLCYYWDIVENMIWNNTVSGIFLDATNYTLVRDNIIFDNEVGVNVTSCWKTNISGNDIGWNTLNAFHVDTNIQVGWNSSDETGNWWHDYEFGELYGITNGTHFNNFDMYPNTSLDLNTSDPLTYETIELDNSMIFGAYALNPLRYEVFLNDTPFIEDTWNGGDVTVNLDGLAGGVYNVSIYVYHVSWHFLAEWALLTVIDSTPPDWTLTIADQEIDEGEAFSYQLGASDVSGLGGWSVNDTDNFSVDGTGLLTNATALSVGVYNVNISVWDSYGNLRWEVMKLEVLFIESTTTTTTTTTSTSTTGTTTSDTLPPPPPLTEEMVLVLAIGGGAFAIIIVIILLRKRGG